MEKIDKIAPAMRKATLALSVVRGGNPTMSMSTASSSLYKNSIIVRTKNSGINVKAMRCASFVPAPVCGGASKSNKKLA